MQESFEVLGLQGSLVQAVENLGYTQPTPIQIEAIPALLSGRNVLGQAQTGTGKTAAFVLPLLQNIQLGTGHIQALILAPTRELAIQVCDATTSMCAGSPIQAMVVYGGQSYEIQLRKIKRGVDIVVGTPGRLMDLMDKGLLDLSHVRYLVLDEADEMLEMGFIDDVETILSKLPEDRQMALFSATLPKVVRHLAERYMKAPHEITVSPTQMTVNETDQSFCLVREEQKTTALVRLLEADQVKSALIFARTKVRVQELADELVRRGYPAESLHGDLSQQRREWVLNRFRNHTISLLVATDVAARGLDVENVSHVFNFDAPEDAEDYVHRIGRTGRAGRKGTAISLFSPRDRVRQAQIEAYMHQKINPRPLPSLETIAARRDDLLIQRLTEQVMQGDHYRERELVAQLAEGDWDLLDLAAAALKMSRQNETALPSEELTPVVSRERSAAERAKSRDTKGYADRRDRRESAAPSGDRASSDRTSNGDRPLGKKGRSSADMVRLWMNMGDTHGLRPSDVVGAIAGEVGIPGRAIGNIDIHHDHTFVDVSEKHVREVLRASSGNYYLRGKPVMLKLAD